MFITSTSNLAALNPKARAMSWPGPRMLLSSSDGQESLEWIASAEHYYLVIDLAVKPASRFDALRIAITRAARARIGMSGPLLFSNNVISDMEVERLERAVKQNPWFIEYANDPMDGRFSMLVLGARIVTGALFEGFFSNLHEGVTETQIGSCICSLEKHLT